MVVERKTGVVVAEGCTWRDGTLTLRELSPSNVVLEQFDNIDEDGLVGWIATDERDVVIRWLDAKHAGINEIAAFRRDARLAR